MTLENLLRIRQLHVELADKQEFNGLLKAAMERLNDAENSSLAYNAAHGLALAALRASGYRSDKRYMVFQCLVHTTNLSKIQTRVFSICHNRRNLAEYEGHFDIDEPLLTELIVNTKQLLNLVKEIKL